MRAMDPNRAAAVRTPVAANHEDRPARQPGRQPQGEPEEDRVLDPVVQVGHGMDEVAEPRT